MRAQQGGGLLCPSSALFFHSVTVSQKTAPGSGHAERERSPFPGKLPTCCKVRKGADVDDGMLRFGEPPQIGVVRLQQVPQRDRLPTPGPFISCDAQVSPGKCCSPAIAAPCADSCGRRTACRGIRSSKMPTLCISCWLPVPFVILYLLMWNVTAVGRLFHCV